MNCRDQFIVDIFKTLSVTFGFSVIFVVRKTKEEEKTMGLTEMLFLCRGWTSKNSWRTAMADNAIL